MPPFVWTLDWTKVPLSDVLATAIMDENNLKMPPPPTQIALDRSVWMKTTCYSYYGAIYHQTLSSDATTSDILKMQGDLRFLFVSATFHGELRHRFDEANRHAADVDDNDDDEHYALLTVDNTHHHNHHHHHHEKNDEFLYIYIDGEVVHHTEKVQQVRLV